MLSEACRQAYIDKMKPDWENSSIGFLVPGCDLSIEISGKSYIQPRDETDETFMERLSRCTPEHNVFAEEWPELHYIPGECY